MNVSIRPYLLPIVLATACAGAAAAPGIDVHVDRRGDVVVVDLSVSVAAPLAVTWAVLTDYEHMPSFVEGLKSSHVTRRDGDHLELTQSGETKVGPLRLPYGSVRRVDVVPLQELRTSLISSDDFKTYLSTTRLTFNGAQTTITYHGEYVPTSSMAALVGNDSIATRTRQQYQQLIDEVLRRAAAGAVPAATQGRAASAAQ